MKRQYAFQKALHGKCRKMTKERCRFPQSEVGLCAAFMVRVVERQRGRQTALTGTGAISKRPGQNAGQFQTSFGGRGR